MLIVLAVTLLLVVVLGAAVGAVSVDLAETLHIIWYHLAPRVSPEGISPQSDQFVWEFRAPRVLLAAICGAGLAVVGVVMQAVVRNPLADPYVLGVSSGAGFGAVGAFLLFQQAVGPLRYAASFAGALLVLVLVLLLSGRRGRLTPGQVVLVGVSLAYIFTALTNFVIYQSDDPKASESVIFWLLGSLGGAKWSTLTVPALGVLAGFLTALWYARGLNAMTAGDETAASLGFDLHRSRLVLLIASAVVTGLIVSVAGGIAFVGLIVPHAARLIMGPEHRRLLPVSALLGAVFLVLVDIVCRYALRPDELPLGVATALIGGPYFLYLMQRRGKGAH